MESKLLIAAILSASWLFVGYSQLFGGSGLDLNCMQKLMPCQAFMHVTSSPPPPSCCTPLSDMLENDKECLCNVFNNDKLLQSFHVTKADALKLPEACGTKADLSLCTATKQADTSAKPPTSTTTSTTDTSAVTPVSSATPTISEGDAASKSNSTDTEKSFAHGLSSSSFGRSAVTVVPVVAWLSLFI